MRKTAKTQARGAGRTAGLPEGFWAKKAARRELANGVTALALRDDTAPLASVQVWVKTGSIHEGARAGSGVSHFLEHMVFKGTGRRTAAAISREAQALGGLMNAYTSFDRTVYHMDLPSEHWAAALDLLADMTLRPALPEAEVARERDVILREIDMCRDDAEQRLWERLFGAVFREHPFRIPIIGHREVFARLGREDLVAYHRERYAPENLVVVVAGDVEEEAALAEIGRLFGAEERRGPAPAFVPAEPAQAGAREACFYEDVELTRGALAWPVGGFADADAPALSALALLLGGGDSSLLWRELRERRRLVHTIDASCWNPGTPGVFCVTFTCDADKRAEVEREVARQLAGVARRGFSKKEIAKAARQLVAGEVASRKTVAGQASRIGGAELASGDPNFSEVWFKRVARVGNAELKRVAGKWLGEGTRTAVSLNPKGAEPAAAPAVVARRGGEVAVETLENGARLVLRRNDRLPTAHFRLLAGGGARAEAAGARGSAALLATLLTRDTERRTAAEVAADIEGAGGSFFPFSGNNSLGLGVEVLRGDEGLALEILEDAALRPAFTRRGFDTEREAQLAELRQDADDVTAVGRKLLREKFFGAHPLAVEPTGREADLRRLSAGEIRALWRRLVVSGNAVLSVCGDFGGEKTVGRLRRFLGRLPEGKAAESAGARGRGAGAFARRMEREQVVAHIGFPGPAIGDADFHAGEVMDELFSGMSSRLFERVREEKGLAYFVRSGRVTGTDAGMFFFCAGTAPGKEREVIAEIWGEIERVKAGGVSEEELARCRARLKAGRVMSLQTNSARAMHAGLNVLHGLPADDDALYAERIDAAGAGELAAFAKARFTREKAVETLAGRVG